MRHSSERPAVRRRETTRRSASWAGPVDRRARLVRSGVSLLDRTSPRLAGRLGEALWFRVPAGPGEERRRRLTPPGGTPFAVTASGLTVRGRVFGDDGNPAAYLVHGWGGYWQQLASYVGPLTGLGYRVVVHDAPSHGDTPAGAYGPRSSRVMELALAHSIVVGRHGPPSLTVAHSLGAMAVLWAAQHHRTPTGALVTIAAATDLDALLDTFCRVVGLGPRSRDHLVGRIERTTGHDRVEFAGTTLARAGTDAVPLLAVHDATDAESPPAVSAQLVDQWPRATLMLTDGLGHRRVIRDPGVVERVSRFAAGDQFRTVRGSGSSALR